MQVRRRVYPDPAYHGQKRKVESGYHQFKMQPNMRDCMVFTRSGFDGAPVDSLTKEQRKAAYDAARALDMIRWGYEKNLENKWTLTH